MRRIEARRAPLTQVVAYRRARGAPPRVEPPPSYGDSARGRPRSRLAGGAWSRSLQARLGTIIEFRLSKFAAPLTQVVAYRRARGAPPRVEPPPSYGDSARGRPRSRLAGGAWSRSLQARLGTIIEFRLSKFAAPLTQVVAYRRARGAPPRVEPPPSYGDSARGRPRSRLAGGAWSRSLQARLGTIIEFRLSKFAAPLTQVVAYRRARGAPPRVEPPPSYGDSARGRPRSRLAGGAWSRSLQARLGTIIEFRLSKFAAPLTQVVAYRRARGAPPRVEPPPSYGDSARGRPRSRLAGGAWSRSLQARLGTIIEFRLSKFAAPLTQVVAYRRARGAPPRVEPPPSYGDSARGRPRSRLAGGAWSRSLQARLGTIIEFRLSKFAAPLTQVVAYRRARGAPPRVEPPPSYGDSARGRPRSRLAGGAWSRSLQARLGTIIEFRLSKFAAPLTQVVAYRRARGAPPRERKQGDCYQSPLPSLIS